MVVIATEGHWRMTHMGSRRYLHEKILTPWYHLNYNLKNTDSPHKWSLVWPLTFGSNICLGNNNNICEQNPPVTGGFSHKDQWKRTVMFSLICAWTNDWANKLDAGELKHHRAYYDVIVMIDMCYLCCLGQHIMALMGTYHNADIPWHPECCDQPLLMG